MAVLDGSVPVLPHCPRVLEDTHLPVLLHILHALQQHCQGPTPSQPCRAVDCHTSPHIDQVDYCGDVLVLLGDPVVTPPSVVDVLPTVIGFGVFEGSHDDGV